MEIKDYEVILNEKNATCGFVINLNYFKLEEFLQEDLHYEVLSKEKKVKVFSANKTIYFTGLSDEIVYYAFKTDSLTLLGGVEGKDGQSGEIKIFAEAKLV